MSKELRILIVDDDQRMTKTLVDILRAKGYQVEAANSAAKALERVLAGPEEAEGPFGCVLTDVKMSGMNGVELSQAIKALDPGLPVILMTAFAPDDLVKAGLESGVIGLLPKPLNINLLLGFLAVLRKEFSVLIVDDDPQFCQTLGEVLRLRGMAVTEVTNPATLPSALDAGGQVMLLDMNLGSTTGLDVLKQLRADHPDLPVILVTGYRAEMTASIDAARAYDVFACMYKPLEIEYLCSTLRQIEHDTLKAALHAAAWDWEQS